MTPKDIDNIHREAARCLDGMAVNAAFDHIGTLAQELGRGDLSNELQRLRISYDLMLKYLSQGIVDPQRGEILTDIRQGLHTLNDRCYIALQTPSSHEVFFARLRELGNVPVVSIIDEYREALQRLQLAQSVPEGERDTSAIMSCQQEAELIETRLFNKVWSTFPLSSDDANSLKLCITGDILPLYARCLLTSALMVGLMKFFDETKVNVLLDAYTEADAPQVQLRALLYALLTLVAYKKRISLTRGVLPRLQALMEQPGFKSDVWIVQTQLARARNTENVKQRVRDELIPNLMKMRPDVLDKINDGKPPITDVNDLEGNPEWQQWLESSGIGRKIEEFNEMQIEGSDVFIATFAHLKSFPFFKTLSNWFLPFHAGHSAVRQVLGDTGSALSTIIQRAPYLCNSDKYSFCLSLDALPASQRGMMSAQLEAQNEALQEEHGASLPDDDQKLRTAIVNAHVKDLYRFFKLFSRRREFVELMDVKGLDLTDCQPLTSITQDAHVLALLGEFYLKNGFNDDAIKCFTRLEANDGTTDEHIYQKIGFAHQNAGNHAEALKYYQRYELLHEDDVWNLRHLASCSRAMGNAEQALEYYRRAEALAPDNVSLTLTIGHVLLELNRTNEALQQYYKADLMPNARHRAWRPIAWCSFLLSDYERALDYYDRIAADDTSTAQDLLNRGHVLLCQGRVQDAIDTYRQSLRLMGNTSKWREAFKGDGMELRLHGVKAVDQALIPEAVCKDAAKPQQQS